MIFNTHTRPVDINCCAQHHQNITQHKSYGKLLKASLYCTKLELTTDYLPHNFATSDFLVILDTSSDNMETWTWFWSDERLQKLFKNRKLLLLFFIVTLISFACLLFADNIFNYLRLQNSIISSNYPSFQSLNNHFPHFANQVPHFH